MPTQTLSTVNKKNPNIPQDSFASAAIAQSHQAQLNVKQQIEQLRNDLTEQERYEQHLKAIAQKGVSAMQQVENTAADIIATGNEELMLAFIAQMRATIENAPNSATSLSVEEELETDAEEITDYETLDVEEDGNINYEIDSEQNEVLEVENEQLENELATMTLKELVDYAKTYDITKEDISRENNNEKKLTAKHYRKGISSLLGYHQKVAA